MKNLARITFILVVLFLFAGVASASSSSLPAFTITGYTTFYEFNVLPNGHVQFHLTAQGGPAVDNDAICQASYGAPCQAVCRGGVGQACGVSWDGENLGDSFMFEEWGVAEALDPMAEGKNHGIMTILGDDENIIVEFKGKAANGLVHGKFKAWDGEHEKLGKGKYAGNAGAIFSVTFTPKSHGKHHEDDD